MIIVAYSLRVLLNDTLPKISPSNSFRPNAWRNEIRPRPKMVGTSQFQRICIGQARISDHTISNSMATNGIIAKVKIDSVSK